MLPPNGLGTAVNMIDKENYLDLVAGKFKKTSSADLSKLFERVAGFDRLVVHFHGGLVSRASATAKAEQLLGVYSPTKSYPIFFIWNSDLWTTLTANLKEIAAERIFKRLVLRVVQLALGKLNESADARGGRLELDPLIAIPKDLEGIEAYATAREPKKPPATELTKAQQAQVDAELGADPVLKQESLAIAANLRPPEAGARGKRVKPRKTRIAAPVLKEIAAEESPPGSRDAATIITVIRYAGKILTAVLRRFARARDHGLYTTTVEEILRTLYFDAPAFVVWKTMKKDTADAFGADAKLFGGTAFLRGLEKWWKPGRRVTLVGHSTGAVYIGHLLDKAEELELQPGMKFDVVFLAPACTFDFMAKRLPVFEKRVANVRMFALTDQNERSYWEVPVLYRGSLLYLVSGLCEDEVDIPILGMQRYHDTKGPVRAEERQAGRGVSEGSLRLVDRERRAGVRERRRESRRVRRRSHDTTEPRAHPRGRLLTYGRRRQEGPRAHRRNQQLRFCRVAQGSQRRRRRRKGFQTLADRQSGSAEKAHQGDDLRQEGHDAETSRHRGRGREDL